MSEVIDFGTTYEEAESFVDELCGLLSEKRSALENLHTEFSAKGKNIDSLGNELETSIREIIKSLNEAESTSNEHKESGIEALENFKISKTESSDTTVKSHEEFNSTHETFDSSINDDHSDFKSQFDELENTFSNVFSSFDTIMETLESTYQQNEDKFNFIHEAISEFSEKTGDFREHTETGFDNFTGEMNEKQAPETKGFFVKFVSELNDKHLPDILGTMNDFEDDYSKTSEEMGDKVDETGSKLIEQSSEMFGNMVNHFTENLVGKLSDTAEETVKGAAEGMITEVGENIGLMSLGSTVTGTLSPWIPQLVVAKALVTAINEFLEMMEKMNPFD